MAQLAPIAQDFPTRSKRDGEVERRVLSVDKGVIEASGLCHHEQLDRSYQLDAEGGNKLVVQ